jgi:hypothetical protein
MVKLVLVLSDLMSIKGFVFIPLKAWVPALLESNVFSLFTMLINNGELLLSSRDGGKEVFNDGLI